MGTSLGVTGYRAALQSTCSLKDRTKHAGGGIQLNVTVPAAGACAVVSANTAGVLWPSHTAPTLPILAEAAGQK